MAQTELLTGLPETGKTARCLSAYVTAAQAASGRDAGGQCIWLTPTREARQIVLRRLLPLLGGVAFQPNVFTFDRFAERVLQETGHEGRSLTGWERRCLLRQLIHEFQAERKFRHFQKISATEGFLDVVSRLITELKRAEIWPETFLEGCQQRLGTAGRRDAELGALYVRYQDVLQEKKWYDDEGRFWLARTAMQTATRGFWRQTSLVVVDGFTDFTQTQLEILEQLAVGTDRLLLTLPLEWPVLRHDLFAKPADVAKHVQRRLSQFGPVRVVRCDESPADQPAGLRQIAQQLFENPRRVPRSSSSSGLVLLSAMGERGEKAAVALRVKRLLAAGISPNQIVIGLRSATSTGQSWLQYFFAAGIPAWCEAAVPWARSPYLKSLFRVLQWERDDWTFERLQAVLNASSFQPRVPGLTWQPHVSPGQITGWLRRLKLHSRRVAILRGLERRRDRLRPDDSAVDRSSLELSCRVLAELSEATDDLRRSHSLETWADILGRLTVRLGLQVPGAQQDQSDADRLQDMLRAAARMEAGITETPVLRTLVELMDLLRDLVHMAATPAAEQPFGCVRIVGAESLRHLQPEYVFLTELTEDSFPSRRGEDCLYSNEDRLQLQQHGMLMSHRTLHQQEELLLFYQSVTRAAVQLTLSFSRVDHQGRENYASPYVTALTDLFAPRATFEEVGQLDPVPDRFDELLTASDMRLAAVVQARQHKPGWWRRLLEEPATQDTAGNMLAAAIVAARRFQTDGFTAYEGRLLHPRHRASLERRYNSQRQFSATELESYAICPFRFWLSSVLELQPLASPEVATDHASRGNLVHDVLARLAEESPEDQPALTRRFQELVAERLQRTIADDELHRALLRVEQEFLDRWAAAYVEQETRYAGKVADSQLTRQQSLHEIPFGLARDADTNSPQRRYPQLVLGTGEDTVRLGGRIDRIDIADLAGQPVFTLIDYKTGKRPEFSPEKVSTGQALQLALYTLAVMQLEIAGPGAVPLWIGYWVLKETGFSPSGGKRGSNWPPLDRAVVDALAAMLDELIPKLVAGIRAGEFVVDSTDPDCTSRCDYRTVCRVNQIRPLADRRQKHRASQASQPPEGQ